MFDSQPMDEQAKHLKWMANNLWNLHSEFKSLGKDTQKKIKEGKLGYPTPYSIPILTGSRGNMKAMGTLIFYKFHMVQ